MNQSRSVHTAPPERETQIAVNVTQSFRRYIVHSKTCTARAEEFAN